MTDITERLRENASLDEIEHGNPDVIALEREAAGEIDKLRARIAELEAQRVPSLSAAIAAMERAKKLTCWDFGVPVELHREIDTIFAVLTATRTQLGAVPGDSHQFKNFHRLLCERFGYTHDERDWRRDQISLIEHIAALTATGGRDALTKALSELCDEIDKHTLDTPIHRTNILWFKRRAIAALAAAQPAPGGE